MTVETAPNRQRADARRNRASILEAARELFAEEGFDAQIDQIARRAGVGVGTVYRHFPNKEDLLEALIADRFEVFAAAARDANADPDAWAGFERYMRESAEVMAGDRALNEAMAERPHMMRAAAIAAGMPELLEQMVSRAQAEGILRPGVTWSDIPGLMCGVGAMTGQASPIGLSWQRYLAIVLDGLRACEAGELPD